MPFLYFFFFQQIAEPSGTPNRNAGLSVHDEETMPGPSDSNFIVKILLLSKVGYFTI
jgi:hypothetical protein